MTTGNMTVDKIGELNITGNIIPQSWYSTIKRESGKPYLTAIVILSDIVYWYKPSEVRDEQTGQIKEYRKKFKSDLLQRSYQQMADMFGISKKDATNAIVFLEKIGVVKRVFRTISINGIVANNVLFIDIIPEMLRKITYPDSMETANETTEDKPEKVTPIPEMGDRGISNKGEVTAKSGETNTENIPETLPETTTKKKERKPTSYDEILSAVEDESLRDLYYEYIKMRKLIKSPMTDRALQMLIDKVNKLEPDSIENKKRLLETAITCNWKSVYPLKEDQKQTQEPKRYGGLYL